MSIRANLSWVLAGTLVCGLCITSYFSWSLIKLERAQYEVSSHSLALRELHSVSEQLDLLLVSSDLAIGSGESYTAQLAMSLANELAKQVSEMGPDGALPHDQRNLDRFEVLLTELGLQINAHESLATQGHDADRSGMLARFDETSGEIVRIFEQMAANAQAYADQKSAELTTRRADSSRQQIMALVLYFLANAVIVFWTIRRIAWPLEELTRSADMAMNDGSEFGTPSRGPVEIVRLARHFGRLVARLEHKVEARTRELLDKTERLEEEVAERKAMHVALESAKESAEKSSRVKSEFLSVMSHELRTPMNAVLGSLSLIRDSGISEEQREYVDIADESGQALIELLGEILDLSKIEAEEFELKKEPFSVYEVLSTTVNMLQWNAKEKGLRLSAQIDPDVPATLIGDFHRVRQILINLVNNAIKFTEKGYIDIHISAAQKIGSLESVRFGVTDSGIGIDKTAKLEVFDSFTQVDSSLTREHSGVGLGLAICSKLAQAMGGSCGVESTPGTGSTFWFTVALPIQAEDFEGDDGLFRIPWNPAPDRAESLQNNSARILIVEDSRANRLIATAILENAGFEVEGAGSGPEAIDKFQKADFDLVLMDLQMSEMDGLETTRAIRNLPIQSSNAPIIAFSANVMEETRRHCIAAGMNDFVSKPFIKETLLDKIAHWTAS